MGTRIERPCSPAFATHAPETSALRRAASPSLPLRPSSLASIRPIPTPAMPRPRPPSVQLAGTSRPSSIRSPSPARSPSSSPSPAPLPLSSRRSASPLRPASPQPSSEVYRNPYHRLSSSPPAVRPPSPAAAPLRRPRSPSPAVTRAVPPALEVHGDSFAGVFSLVGSRAIVHKYKGASARVRLGQVRLTCASSRSSHWVTLWSCCRDSTTRTQHCKSRRRCSRTSRRLARPPFSSCLARSTSPLTTCGTLWAH